MVLFSQLPSGDKTFSRFKEGELPVQNLKLNIRFRTQIKQVKTIGAPSVLLIQLLSGNKGHIFLYIGQSISGTPVGVEEAIRADRGMD